jgi:hypothetical protein
MGEKGPESWIRATDLIRSRPEKYVSVENFRQFADEYGIEEPFAFLSHLHYSGEATFYSRNPIHHPETAELDDWVILKPEWLLQQVSALLTDEATRRSAEFCSQDLSRIWPNMEPTVRRFLTLLMDHFDLC